MKFKVLTVAPYDSDSKKILENLLNVGWKIERADTPYTNASGYFGTVIYILRHDDDD